MADMTEKEVDLHKGLLQEKKSKKSKKSKKFKSSTLPFNQSIMHTDLVPEQLDWRDYGTQTNIIDHFCPTGSRFPRGKFPRKKDAGARRTLEGLKSGVGTFKGVQP